VTRPTGTNYLVLAVLFGVVGILLLIGFGAAAVIFSCTSRPRHRSE